MTRVSFSFILTSLLFILLGCSVDPNYEAEKAYWEVSKIKQRLNGEHPEGLKEEHYNQIIDALQGVVNVAPMEELSAQAQFQIAQIYLDLNKTEQALETLESIFARFSESENKGGRRLEKIVTQVLLWIGRIYEEKGKLAQAEGKYAILMDRYPLTSIGLEIPIHIIRYHRNKGNVSKMKEASAMALAHYQELISKYSGTSIVDVIRRYSLKVYVLEEAWQDVLDFWESEIDMTLERSELIRAKIAKADLLADQMEDISKAEEIYKDLIERYPVEPITPSLKIRLGYLLIKASKTEEAREIFNKIPINYPKDEELIVQSHLGIASADYKDGKYEKMIKRLDDVYAKYPNVISALKVPLMKHLYLKKMGKSEDEVEEMLKEASNVYSTRWDSGGSTEFDRVLGRLLLLCLIQIEDWDAATAHIKSLAERFPNNISFLRLMDNIYQRTNDNLSITLQLLFDRSNDSPFFQHEDLPMLNIEEPFDDAFWYEN